MDYIPIINKIKATGNPSLLKRYARRTPEMRRLFHMSSQMQVISFGKTSRKSQKKSVEPKTVGGTVMRKMGFCCQNVLGSLSHQ